MVVFTLLSLQCSSTKPLSDTEKEKLDPPLIRLLSGKNADDSRINKYIRSDGTQEIRCRSSFRTSRRNQSVGNCSQQRFWRCDRRPCKY